MPSVLDKTNELVARAETRRFENTYQTAAAGQIADPNAEADPAAVGVPVNGVKSLLLEAYAEAGGSASLRVWVYRGPRGAATGAGWVVPPGGNFGAVTALEGFAERFDVSGYTRCFVQTYDVVGAGMNVVYGKGVLE